jgi:hypothetical protein
MRTSFNKGDVVRFKDDAESQNYKLAQGYEGDEFEIQKITWEFPSHQIVHFKGGNAFESRLELVGLAPDAPEKFEPKDTLEIQSMSLVRFMLGLGYIFDAWGKHFVVIHDQGRIGAARDTLSFGTAIRLHNATESDWISCQGLYWLPNLNSLKFRKYYWDCAQAAKVVRQVKLQITSDREVKTSDDNVRFMKPEYEGMLKRGFM